MVHRSYRIGDFGFGIRTTSEDFCRWLDLVLSEYSVSETFDPLYSVVIGEENGNHAKGLHILYRRTQRVVRTLHLPTLARALLLDMEAILFADRTDALYLDAAVIGGQEITALVPASVATYLEGLGRRAARAGIALPTGSYVAVDPSSGQVVPPRPLLDVPSDSLDLLPRIGSDQDGTRLVIDKPRSVDVVCTFLTTRDWGRQAPSTVEPVSRALALHYLGSVVLNLEKLGGEALRGLERLLRGTHTYSVSAFAGPPVLKAIQERLIP